MEVIPLSRPATSFSFSDMPMSIPGPRIKTPLHDHQKVGLSKLLFMENDFRSLYEALIRFDPSLDEKQSLDLSSFSHIWTYEGDYIWRNKLNGERCRSKLRPFQGRGLILADDMGTGKSLTILSLIESTLEAVDTWMRNHQADPELPYYRLPRMYTNDEIYIDAPPASNPSTRECKPKFWNTNVNVDTFDFEAGPSSISKGPSSSPKSGATLIICPKTVMPIWTKCIEDHWQGTVVLGVVIGNVHQTPVANRPLVVYDQYSNRRNKDPTPLINASIVLTSYEALTASRMKDQGSLHQVTFYRVVLDEGHRVRNRDTQCFRAVQALKARHMHILTGTPIHNHPMDMVGYARLLETSSKTTGPNAFQALIDTSALEDIETSVSGLRHWGKTFMLRRLKRDLDRVPLPSKTIQCFWLKDKTDETDFALAMDGPSRPWLVGQDAVGANEEIDRREEWFGRVASGMVRTAPPPSTSVKMRWFKHFLNTQTHGKIVVFHHYRTTFEEAESILHDSGYEIMELQADTEDRAEVAEVFNNRADGKLCLLSSMMVGGEGVSLIGASACVFLDLWWKPASHDQAIDRLHRQGQTRPVTAYIPVALQNEGDCSRWIRQQVKRTFMRLISRNDPPSEYSLTDFPYHFLKWMSRYDPAKVVDEEAYDIDEE
ncbi:hypothetical protein I302_106950 [Kwoniella bestiolae CBS 10118]|uniref:Helicase n=1 Tax=Kwoniella bestiolae CBS 10118 TaxID=1296100 RepID=A0A1B9FZY3_9TREE|nr:hypothetical protein I302_05784 [Kwoniella bestiolae CBS 10118]OCF24325.1 hypothetical protein I302_05784 [Kwoniella bestiolae CBS 10118]